jgi:hypothetical protein
MPRVGLVEEDVLAVVNGILIIVCGSIVIIILDVVVRLSGMSAVIISWQTVWLDAVFYAELLPEFSTYLVAALTDL